MFSDLLTFAGLCRNINQKDVQFILFAEASIRLIRLRWVAAFVAGLTNGGLRFHCSCTALTFAEHRFSFAQLLRRVETSRSC